MAAIGTKVGWQGAASMAGRPTPRALAFVKKRQHGMFLPAMVPII
jgi:hypothetical protein